jgi:hypothetical protein
VNNPKSPKIAIGFFFAALVVSVAWHVHDQAVYNRQIRHMQEQINYMHNHPGMALPPTLSDKP